MSPGQVENWIVRLRQRLEAAEAAVVSLSTRITTLEALLLNVPGERLLGRWSPTTGPAQFIRIGTGLDLVDDVLVNTGGGGSSAIASFTLICLEDATEHLVRIVLDGDDYILRPDQSPGGSDAVAGKTLTCGTDGTSHVLRLRLDQGYYTLELVQAPGGTGAVTSITMIASDSTERTVTCVLDQGYYQWRVI